MIWITLWLFTGLFLSIWIVHSDRLNGHDITWGELIFFPLFTILLWPITLYVYIDFNKILNKTIKRIFSMLNRTALSGKKIKENI